MFPKSQAIKARPLTLPSLLSVKASLVLVFLLGLGIGISFEPLSHSSNVPLPVGHATMKACFSPGGGCTEAIVTAIHSANTSIDVMAYALTSSVIAKALVKAHERGVKVRILVDRSQLKTKHSQVSFLLQKGISVSIDPAAGIAHNKVMIFDNESLLTGSFNFSQAAEIRNAENLLLIHDPSLARLYKQNWEERAKRAKPLF
jgi:phospholipase D